MNPQVNPAYEPYLNHSKETGKFIALFVGGRNSGKSRALAQVDMKDLIETKQRMAYIRKVGASINDSMIKELKDVVYSAGAQDHFDFLVNPLCVRVSNGSEVITKGCDDPEKLKSLAECTRVRVDELSELSTADIDTILFSIRGESTIPKQFVGSMNPVKCAAKDYFFKADGRTLTMPEQVYYCHTTWRDNKFCGSDWAGRMERLKEQNANLHKIVSEGEWADMEGLVYKYDTCKEMPKLGMIRRGMDFGYNDPSALVEVCFHNGTFYVDELVYGTELNETTLHGKMMDARLWETRNVKTLCDNAYKMTIDALHGRGWNVHPCIKPKVQDSVQWLAGFPIRITERSTNLLKEIETYIFAVDKYGKPLNVPVDFDNHGMDAMRYAALDLKPYTGEPKTSTYESVGKRVSFAGIGDDDDD
jgi:phage terminase large subunit